MGQPTSGIPMANDDQRIGGWLQPENILLDVDVRDARHALEVAAAEIARAHGLDRELILHMLWRREQVGSTGLGNGFAIPHARIAGITRPTTLFMRTKAPIAFDAPDGKPVSELLTIMVPPDGADDDHLRLLALVSRLFSDPRFRAQLERAPDSAAAAEIFRAGIALLTVAK